MEPETFADIGADLLEAAADCLDAHSPSGAPTMRFMSQGDPIWPGCSYLAVWISQIYPTNPFPQQAPTFNTCSEIEWAVSYTLKLRRCPYPHLKRPSGKPEMPDSDEVNTHAEALAVDARVLLCCITADWAAGLVLTNPNMPAGNAPAEVRRLPVQFGAMRPYRQANVAGWDWVITAGVAPCCELPEIVASGD